MEKKTLSSGDIIKRHYKETFFFIIGIIIGVAVGYVFGYLNGFADALQTGIEFVRNNDFETIISAMERFYTGGR